MFSIKEAVVFGWHKLKQHSGIVFGVVLTLFALQIATSVVDKSLEGTVLGFVASIVLAIAGVVLGAGMTLIFLKLAKGEPVEYREIVPQAAVVWKYFCVSILSGLIAFLPVMAGGLISLALLLSTDAVTFSGGVPVPAAGSTGIIAVCVAIMIVAIVVAIYLGLRYSMARLAAIDGEDITESIRASARLTRGNLGKLILFMLALVALNIVGLLVFVVGLLVTIPMSMLAFAHVYLRLKERQGAAA